jgi:hypothetical protein
MSQHFISTTARPTTCPGCGASILAAIDAGLPAHVNTQPLPPAHEPAVLLTGAWTYTHTKAGHLIHRTATHIRADTAGTIHAQHQCPTPTLI